MRNKQIMGPYPPKQGAGTVVGGYGDPAQKHTQKQPRNPPPQPPQSHPPTYRSPTNIEHYSNSAVPTRRCCANSNAMGCIIVQNQGIGRSGAGKGRCRAGGMRYVNDNYYLAVALLYVYMQMHYGTAGSPDHSCVYGRMDVFTVSACLRGQHGNLSSHHNHQSCHMLFKNT